MHKLTEVEPARRRATCAVCGPETVVYKKGLDRQGAPRFKCGATRSQAYKRRARARAGGYAPMTATAEELDAAYKAQAGACRVCLRVDARLVPDHCHASGQFRGWLCDNCNRGIGMFRDQPELLEAAAAYLRD